MGTNEPGKFTGKIDDEILAQTVIHGCKKLSSILPELKELRRRFLDEDRSKPIGECSTWYEFCIKKLDRKPSAIRKALAPDKTKTTTEEPNPFDAVWKRINTLLSLNGDGDEHKFITDMKNLLGTDITEDTQEEARLILYALREIIVNFTTYANELEGRIRVAGVA